MRKLLYLFVLLTLVIETVFSHESPVLLPKKNKDVIKTNLEVGAGLMRSVLYLSRNIKEDNDALGYSFYANYGGHKLLRIGVQYTTYKAINIEPTWYNIRAYSIESNVEILARFQNNKTFLYPFVGLSYNSFKGYFTGMNDYLGLRERFQVNATVRDSYLGVNCGTGIEHAFGPVVIFFDYRMRVGKSEVTGKYLSGINIMDVCYGGGLRYKLSVPTLKKLFRGIGDKYHWF